MNGNKRYTIIDMTAHGRCCGKMDISGAALSVATNKLDNGWIVDNVLRATVVNKHKRTEAPAKSSFA